MKPQSIMEDILLWNEGQKHYCEFTIDKKTLEELNLKVGDEINLTQ